MTRRDLANQLADAGIAEAQTEAMLLFCHFSGLSRAAALADRDADCAAPALLSALARRKKREPLAYILGEAWFYGERYEVSPACLIPRPETEMLVEYACAHLPRGGRFADFCTGSGCIAISTLVHRSDCTGDAYDLSPDALALAERNAEANGVRGRIAFYQKNLLITGGVCCETPYDMILSNPPYVVRDEIDGLAPEIAHEPRMAFDGGEDGLDFYAFFLEYYRDLLTADGSFVFEIGAAQGAALMELADRFGYLCRIERDAAGLDRTALVTKKH